MFTVQCVSHYFLQFCVHALAYLRCGEECCIRSLIQCLWSYNLLALYKYAYYYYCCCCYFFLPGENPWWLKNYRSKLQNCLAGRHQQNCRYYYQYFVLFITVKILANWLSYRQISHCSLNLDTLQCVGFMLILVSCLVFRYYFCVEIIFRVKLCDWI